MKLKHFFLSLVILLSFTSVFAQLPNAYPITMTNSLDTISNTTPQNCSITVTEYNKLVAAQIVVTKRTGTIAGKAELQGSIDGTNYKRIATDTLLMTNQTTNTYVWVISNPCYYKYRILVTGSGTMSASISGSFLKRKENN